MQPSRRDEGSARNLRLEALVGSPHVSHSHRQSRQRERDKDKGARPRTLSWIATVLLLEAARCTATGAPSCLPQNSSSCLRLAADREKLQKIREEREGTAAGAGAAEIVCVMGKASRCCWGSPCSLHMIAALDRSGSN